VMYALRSRVTSDAPGVETVFRLNEAG
jgi:hypothetical protein